MDHFHPSLSPETSAPTRHCSLQGEESIFYPSLQIFWAWPNVGGSPRSKPYIVEVRLTQMVNVG